MKELREELEVVRRTEIASLEERKNKQVHELVQANEQAFSDIKNYYNDITISNLALINTLKVPWSFEGTFGLFSFLVIFSSTWSLILYYNNFISNYRLFYSISVTSILCHYNSITL